LWVVFGSARTQGSILDFKELSVAFTNAAEAQAKATWSEPDKINVTQNGLGWDGESAASRDGWIRTKPIALGLSWRPAYAISLRARVQPPPREFSLSNGQRSKGDAGDIYVRYSPDLKHWSSWQVLQRSEPQSVEEKKTPARYYTGTVRVPFHEREVYSRLLSEYSAMDVPWKSDEEAAVKWMLTRDPDLFAKHIPFIGYAEFLFEGEFRGNQRIQFLKVDISYGMSGLHSVPRDAEVYQNRDVPWRFGENTAPKDKPTTPEPSTPLPR